MAGLTNSTHQNAITTLVTSLKNVVSGSTQSLWTKMKAIYPFVGGNATSHKFNLKDPRDLDAAYRLIFTAAGGANSVWSHTSNGIQVTGSAPNNTYANTRMSPLSTLTINSTHVSFYSRTSTLGTTRDVSILQGGSNPSLTIGFENNNLISDQYSSSQRLQSTVSDGLGFFISTRTTSTIHKSYKNGSLVGTDTRTNSTSLPNGHIYIGCASLESTPGTFLGAAGQSIRQYAFATIGNGLTDTESTELYNIIQTYQTTLGRQV
jgi:hypothetical protein